MMLHFLEFRTREGMMCLQRADEISTVLESTIGNGKDKPKQTILYLLLRNNNRIEVVGETRESLFQKFYSINGTLPNVVHRVVEEEPEAAPEPAAA